MPKVHDSFTGVTVDAPPAPAEAQGSDPQVLAAADRKMQAATDGVALSHASPSNVSGLTSASSYAVGHIDSVPTRHPILQITRARYGHGHLKQLQLVVYHVMRRYVDTLDNAINNRRMLEGDLVVQSEDEGLQDAIQTFIDRVPVGFVDEAPQRGLDTYLDELADKADEYGLAAGEVRVDGSKIERLVAPNPRTLTLQDRDGDGLDELYQSQTRRSGQKADRRIDDNERVHTLSFSHPTEEGWPRPLAWSLVTNTEAVLRMYEAVANGWYRFGDPSMLVTEEYEQDANPDTTTGEQGGQVPVSLKALASQIQQVFQKRKNGQTSDAFHAVQGADVSAEVLGEVDNTLMEYFSDHQGTYAAKVIAASQTPRWMYPELSLSGDGMNSDRATNENSLAAEAAKKRDRRRMRVAEDVIDTWLTLNGDARFAGDYTLMWDRQSLANRKLEAEARKLEAEGDAQHVKNAGVLFDGEGGRRFGGDAERYLEERGVYDQTG